MDAVTVYHEGQTFGRPTKYGPETLEKVFYYLENYKKIGHAIPSVVGLARYLKVSKQTIYSWAEREGMADFLDMLEQIQSEQEFTTINQSLKNNINSNIAKLILTKHGYHDRAEIASFNVGGGRKKEDHEITIVSTDPTRVMHAINVLLQRFYQDQTAYQKQNPDYKFDKFLPTEFKEILDSYLYPERGHKDEDLIPLEDE